MTNASLIFASSIRTPCKSPSRKANVLRCVLVNDANLKIRTCCAACQAAIGSSYIRSIADGKLFCCLDCYRGAADGAKLLPGPVVFGFEPGGTVANSGNDLAAQ